jgi:2-polyprenyl-3-methyl-5-hydroxy-6-metoxy-1,4-benzoquinol methylase
MVFEQVVTSRILHKLISLRPIKKFRWNRSFVRAYFSFLYLWSDPYHILREEEINKSKKAFRLVEAFRAKKGLEVGCGEGRLSHNVAAICEHVLAVDISDTAIKRAKKMHRGNIKIKFLRTDLLSHDFSEETYDFIFCSEVLYYLGRQKLNSSALKIIRLLNHDGKLLLVHHRSIKDDSSGVDKEFGAKTIHGIFIHNQQLELEEDIIDVNYRITLLRRE